MRRGLFLLVLLLGCSREPDQPPPVVVISIDTLRSDHLRAYGYGGTSTPAIDRLAADGIVFERAWAHVPLTLPSHTSLMTGLLPPEHGVRDNAGATLDPKTPTIASMLRAHGYKSGGAVSAYVLRAATNINAGFDHFDDRVAFVEGAPTGNLQRAGRDTVRAIMPWLDANARQPFFLFVHFFEPHAPYERGSYDAEITKVDEAVSELLDAIRIQKRYDDTLIILTSDHGEGLRDHGEQEHGVLLYRESLQVPLIVKLPRSQRRGTRVRESAQLIDILPTIAAITGATPPANLRGKSLLDALGERPSYAETLYPRIHLGWSELRSIMRWPMHLIDGPKPELYRVDSDPRERRNVLDAERRAFTQLRGDLAAVPQRALTASRISEEEARKLAALGYVSAGRPVASSNLNPREHLADLDELKTTTELLAKHDYKNAATKLEELLTRNPGWSDLRDQLGLAYERLGDFASAERVYRDAIAATPELAPEFALSLAQAQLAQGKLDDAERHADIAMRTNPSAAKLVLAQTRAARRDFDGAMVILDELQQTPQPPRYWFVRGDVLARTNRLPEARDAFERAIVVDPRHVDAYIALALVQRISGDVAGSDATLTKMVVANPETRELAERRRREWAR